MPEFERVSRLQRRSRCRARRVGAADEHRAARAEAREALDLLAACHYDCDVLTALGDSPDELEPLDSSELSLASVLPLDSSPLAAASLDSSLDSPELELVDPPPLPLVLDALCTDEVERAFDEADSAGSCPDASWT